MCVCVLVCVCVRVCVCMCVYVFACVHMCVCVGGGGLTCENVSTSFWALAYTSSCLTPKSPASSAKKYFFSVVSSFW